MWKKSDYKRPQANGGADGGGASSWKQKQKLTKPPTTEEENNDDAVVEDDQQKLEEAFGFTVLKDGSRLGWLMNMQPSSISYSSGSSRSCLDCYFVDLEQQTFKVRVPYEPYFYIATRDLNFHEVESFLKQKFRDAISQVTAVMKEDLDLRNHLSGIQRKYMKISFYNVQGLLHVRAELQPAIEKNRARMAAVNAYEDPTLNVGNKDAPRERTKAATDYITDMREYDVPYYIRASIDMGIRVGHWYKCDAAPGEIALKHQKDMLERANTRILAFDIETTKQPLKFPNPAEDSIMMISYMIDKQGYLIINRSIVSQDIEDFEFTPRADLEGPFIVYNEPDEAAVLQKWFAHIKQTKPNIYVSFNGDSFDWPFIEARARFHNMSLMKEIGVRKDASGEYKARFASHMDALCWVIRDSYLPQGSHGLKKVTKAKLGYDPLELDPEDMLRFAQEKPQTLASYSVSDAVATFYLYLKYVHPFIFSLCTIIPMNPDDVLRKGSGTLCETLLMVEAYHARVIYPNKAVSKFGKLYKGHLLESETYIGGHVESLHAGVFRSDLPMNFDLDVFTLKKLISEVDAALTFFLEIECKVKKEDVVNFADVKKLVIDRLQRLLAEGKREGVEGTWPERVNGHLQPPTGWTAKQKSAQVPLIYHLDVAAMYPNIILTNRLQPTAIVDEPTCAACDFNRPESDCQRRMKWTWRGDYLMADKKDFESVKAQLEVEKFPKADGSGKMLSFFELPEVDQHAKILKRLKEFSRKTYKKIHKLQEEDREATVCQRENSFYVNTVRAFRDRRYDYKEKHKHWRKEQDKAGAEKNLSAQETADKMVILYDSLQMAHKCILNSFYGYVMRKGARWYSMEMAGIVTHTGSQIIQMATQLVHAVGIPLELDTDGIWCCLPALFPEGFEFKTTNKRSLVMSYPCTMLNLLVHDTFANTQYQDLKSANTKEYEKHTECSILFEVDGPYRAMILPASKDEGRKLKKRYAVFHKNGTLAELKGFEIKRRSELKLIQIFQSQVFENFLAGKTLDECYRAVGAVADHWLDVLYTKGAKMDDAELLELISASSNMSKKLSEYGTQKSSAISTAKRLAEFLDNEDMVKDKGLACKFVIAKKPVGKQVTERAIPVAVFNADPSLRLVYLRKWLEDRSLASADLRDIVDWDYYIQRLSNAVQKIITIPAALQDLSRPVDVRTYTNAVPRVRHPDWLEKTIQRERASSKQVNLLSSYRDSHERTMRRGFRDNLEKKVQELDLADLLGAPLKRADKFTARRIANLSDVEFTDLLVPAGDEGAEEALTRAERQTRALELLPLETRKALGEQMAKQAEEDDETLAAAMSEWDKRQSERQQQAVEKRNKFNSGVVDMEDIGTAALKTDGAHVVAKVTKRARGGVSKEAENNASVDVASLGPMPNEQESYDKWLAWMKAKWKTQREERKRRREQGWAPPGSANSGALARKTKGANMNAFLSRTQVSLATGNWEVLSVAETETPGNFAIWFLLDHKQLQSVTVSMPRQIYVNSLEAMPIPPMNQITMKEVKKYLPRGRARVHLYELAMPETLYRKISPTLVKQFLKPEIEGVYENRIPSAFTAAIQFDCMVRVKPSSKGAVTSKKVLSCDDIEPQHSDRLLYLQKTQLRELYLYNSMASNLSRGIFALFVTDTHKLYIFVVRDYGSATQLARMVKRAEGWAEWTLDERHYRTYNTALRELNRVLSDERRVAAPPLLVRQVSLPQDLLLANAPVIRDFPCLQIPANDSDNQYAALQWEETAASLALKRCTQSKEWVKNQIDFARYSGIPLCNIDSDLPLWVADVFYARVLRQHGHLLWASDGPRADLGGKEEDESLLADAIVNPEICAKGWYNSFSIELEVFDLPLATVLESHLLAESEGSALGMDVSLATLDKDMRDVETAAQAAALDESAQSAVQFRVLKAIVRTWAADAWKRASYSPLAVMLLQNLYRWISSPRSRLYDPALHRFLHGMMKKFFLQVVAELRNLGAKIVFANFHKIIIGTNKVTREAAEGYADFILKHIGQKPLFKNLALKTGRYFEALLFLDEANFAAVPLRDSPSQRHEVVHNWALCEQLPADLATHLQLLVAVHVLAQTNLRPADQTTAQPQASQAGPAALMLDKFEEFQQRCFRTVGELQLQYENQDEEEDETAGSRTGGAITEMVKYLCHILELDKELSEEVTRLRKGLLKLVGVQEFSAQAELSSVSRSFSLSNVTCTYCGNMRDMDLLKDPSLSPGQPWRCEICDKHYDKSAIEAELVSIAERLTVRYQVQDLKCIKCGLVPANNMGDLCTNCSGQLRTSEAASELRKTFEVFRRIAELHMFEWLEETCMHLLGSVA